MYLLGMFLAGSSSRRAAEQDDLDFFTFPEVDNTIGADAIEAPIDGYMMSAKPEERGRPRRAREAAPAPRGPGPGRRVRRDRADIAANDKAARPVLLQRAAEEGRRVRPPAKSIAQFMDRDTRPDFCVDGDDPRRSRPSSKNPSRTSTGRPTSIEAKSKDADSAAVPRPPRPDPGITNGKRSRARRRRRTGVSTP